MVVMEMTASNGAKILILDDAYAGISPDEERRRKEATGDAILRIYENAAAREAAAAMETA